MTIRYCLHCDDGTRLVRKRRDLKVQVKKHQATVNSVLGWHCPICGEVEFAPGEGRRYSAALEALADTVAAGEAADLRAIRLRLGLTQAAAAALTGGGHNAFSRYERGEVRPLPAVINLFRALDKHPELLAELRWSRSATRQHAPDQERVDAGPLESVERPSAVGRRGP